MKAFLKSLYKDNSWKHWQSYRTFFHVVIFRYLVFWFAIVPVVATILSKLSGSIDFEPVHTKYTITLGLPFTWEYLWIASFLFMIAYALYAGFCPRLVKKYESFKDYRADMHSPRWLAWLSRDLLKDKTQSEKFFDRMLTKKYFVIENAQIDKSDMPKVIVEEKQSKLYFEREGILYSFGMPILSNNVEDKILTEIAEREVFWEVFGRWTSSKQGVRFIILVLLYSSACFFAVVFIEHIISAIAFFWK